MNDELWYKEIGYYQNPFNIKPAVYDYEIVGYADVLRELFYRIPSGTLTFVQGDLGTGKTTILKHLIQRYKGQKKVIYFACNRIDKELNVELLLKERYGFWGRMFGRMPKGMIVLLDEAQDLTKKNVERIKNYFDQKNIKSVVFAGTHYKESIFTNGVKERMGPKGMVELPKLTADDAVLLIRRRIGGDELLTDNLIRNIFKLSENNPRRFLHNCERVARKAVEDGRLRVQKKDLEILEPKPDKPKPTKKTSKQSSVKPINGLPRLNIRKVEGIGEKYAEKLKEAGIETTDALLMQGATRKGREEIAEKSGIGKTLILTWVNHVDLFRIKGVSEEYADLLEEAGVDTVPDLATRNPENLVGTLAKVNESKSLVRKLPSQSEVVTWVTQAKKMSKIIQY